MSNFLLTIRRAICVPIALVAIFLATISVCFAAVSTSICMFVKWFCAEDAE
jgi:hypothetical protein